MTGREKVKAAFSAKGTPEVPVVICYESVLFRDHWEQLTSCPWWYRFEYDLERQLQWYRDYVEKTGQDWFFPLGLYSKAERETMMLEERSDGVYVVEKATGNAKLLERPIVGGGEECHESEPVHPDSLCNSETEIDEFVDNYSRPCEEGKYDLARMLVEEHGGSLFPMAHLGSPFRMCYEIWGFEGLMLTIASKPELIKYACQKFLEKAFVRLENYAKFGAAGIWIEEIFTDMISPATLESVGLPSLKKLINKIHDYGMKSIYYFCGDPQGRVEVMVSSGTDAIALEDSKKGFICEIDQIAKIVDGRCTLLGNLDPIAFLQDGTQDELRKEIELQLSAGKINKNRFIMCIGSPVTPATPVARVKEYCDITKSLI
jgi:uroporphyrinogen decarboxylase-like protein